VPLSLSLSLSLSLFLSFLPTPISSDRHVREQPVHLKEVEKKNANRDKGEKRIVFNSFYTGHGTSVPNK
jgi:hypothetical protein